MAKFLMKFKTNEFIHWKESPDLGNVPSKLLLCDGHMKWLGKDKYDQIMCYTYNSHKIQKQPPRRALKIRYSENMQQIYRRTPMSKYDFNKVLEGKR